MVVDISQIEVEASKFADEVVKRAVDVGEGLKPGEFVRLDEFVLEFLPDVWGGLSGVDWGSGCRFWRPLVYRNRDGVVQFYVEEWVSRELGDGNIYVVEENGRLSWVRVTSEHWKFVREWTQRIADSAVFEVCYESYDIDGPFGVELLWGKARDAYKYWKSEKMERGEAFSF